MNKLRGQIKSFQSDIKELKKKIDSIINSCPLDIILYLSGHSPADEI